MQALQIITASGGPLEGRPQNHQRHPRCVTAQLGSDGVRSNRNAPRDGEVGEAMRGQCLLWYGVRHLSWNRVQEDFIPVCQALLTKALLTETRHRVLNWKSRHPHNITQYIWYIRSAIKNGDRACVLEVFPYPSRFCHCKLPYRCRSLRSLLT